MRIDDGGSWFCRYAGAFVQVVVVISSAVRKLKATLRQVASKERCSASDLGMGEQRSTVVVNKVTYMDWLDRPPP